MVARPGGDADPLLGDAEIDEIEAGLAAMPAPLEPLDACMLDGFLCGVLVQPQRPREAEWLRFITDVEGRGLPKGVDVSRLHALVRRRHRELDTAIEARRWFDPWVFEIEDSAAADDDGSLAAAAVYPWVAGFVTAMEAFPALLQGDPAALQPALVLLYRHLEPDDLEDADELLEAIAELEPPADVGVAVEELVRATLLLADIARPLATRRPSAPPATRRRR